MTKGPGMRELCKRLERLGFPFSDAHAIEVFARRGDWHTADYAQKIESLEAWEIDKSHLPFLSKNLPLAEIKHVDSIQHIREPENFNTADLVVIDNPQNTFGQLGEHCEHFDVIDPALQVLRPDGVVIFNVNIEPFDYGESPNWKLRREEFYDSKNTGKLALGELVDFYTRRFETLGRTVIDHMYEPRTDYLYYFAYRLK